MDQGGGLQGLPRWFLGHLVRRQLTQLVIDQRQQLLGGQSIALLDGRKNACDLAHD
jgi:hypothetical protein